MPLSRKPTARIFIYAWIVLLQVIFSNYGMAAEITQHQLLDRLGTKSDLLILDVRRPDEFNVGHVPNAINIPHTELEDHLEQLRTNIDKGIVVYCESGRRAAIAKDILTRAGFTRILHLQGDMKAWRMNGLPIQEDNSHDSPRGENP